MSNVLQSSKWKKLPATLSLIIASGALIVSPIRVQAQEAPSNPGFTPEQIELFREAEQKRVDYYKKKGAEAHRRGAEADEQLACLNDIKKYVDNKEVVDGKPITVATLTSWGLSKDRKDLLCPFRDKIKNAINVLQKQQ